MAQNGNSRPIKTDRFGNPYQVVSCRENRGGYPVGYAEIQGKLYKIEPADSNKEGVKMWVRITKMANNRPTSM